MDFVDLEINVLINLRSIEHRKDREAQQYNTHQTNCMLNRRIEFMSVSLKI